MDRRAVCVSVALALPRLAERDRGKAVSAWQALSHLQVVVNLIDYGMNPQAALDAPRWQFVRDNLVLLEPSVPQTVAIALTERGHKIQPGNFFGRGQVILKQ